MTINTKQELIHATGMVERRVALASTIGKSNTQKEAVMTHQEMCGAVREVTKHRHNIVQSIDNESAGHAISADALLATAQGWLEQSRLALGRWGVSESEIKRIEGGLL
jgi:hypothetical protein